MPGRIVCAVVLICLLASSAEGDAADYPKHLWTVEDDTLDAPFGSIWDASVDAHGVVYLFDRQILNVRRFGVDGTELPPLGRKGEGPGELMFPSRIAAYPDGGCLILEEFFRPWVCLRPGGSACDPPPGAAIRQGFAMVLFQSEVRIDDRGRVYVATLTTDTRGTPGGPRTDLGTVQSLFRVTPGTDEPEILMTTRDSLGGPDTVHLAEHNGGLLLVGWDVDRRGRMIYVDPGGESRVIIGHPADGESRAIDIPWTDDDERGRKQVAELLDLPEESMRRVIGLQWLDADCILVTPMRAFDPDLAGNGEAMGPYELFDSAGNPLGQRVPNIDYDPGCDDFFLRGHVAIVVKGGKSATRSWLSVVADSMELPEVPCPEIDFIRVIAYDMRP